ncbi:leo1-like family protein [Wolffia australiana]
MGGEMGRNEMLQNIFGEHFDEDEEEEEVDSDHEAAAEPSNHRSDGENEADNEEDQGEADLDVDRVRERDGDTESEGELHGTYREHVESEGERALSSSEREASDQRLEREEKDEESDDHGYGHRVKTSRRREVIASDSERSDDNEDEEDQQSVKPSGENDRALRDILGDSDEDEEAGYESQHELERRSHRSPDDGEESEEKVLRPEDVIPDEDSQNDSDDENLEQKPKEKPVGPPLEIEIPIHRPPSLPQKMNMIKVSNIMGVEPKPFDPKTYVEEDVFVTDESGTKKRIRLEDNIVRWRRVRNRDGTTTCESNARFVRWSDGSLQLLIGNEVLDITVQGSQHDQTHLFLRHGKGILQSQGRLLQKMRFMPSSLSSKSHRLLTALVDSRHKKVYKVKNCITDIDPEREKEEREKAESQTIRANELYHRRREKISRKYAPVIERGRQLSPGFLEDALEEDEDMEIEAQAERRIMSAKRSLVSRDVTRRPPSASARSARRAAEYSESEREESEYETEGERAEDGESGEELEAEEAGLQSEEEDEEEEPRRRDQEGRSKRKGMDSDSESPTRKAATHRRKAFVYDSDDD